MSYLIAYNTRDAAGAPWWEHLAIVFWVYLTTFTPPWSTPFLYMLAAFFTANLFLLKTHSLLPVMGRGWIAFLMPVMCVISALWAPDAAGAIRRGLLLAMTAFVAINMAGRLSSRQLIYSYFAVEFFAGVLSIINPDVVGKDATGIFDQKNMLAIHMFFLYSAAIAMALDPTERAIMRMLSVAAMPIALALIWMSHSMTTVAMVLALTMAFLVQAFVWQPAARVIHLRTLMALVAAILVSLVVLIVFGLIQLDAMKTVLEAMGKDSTLTGRTYLWDQARELMDAHPLTGMGAGGFWRPEVGQANSLIHYFYYKSFVKFSFHNSYLEAGVELGYPGMYAAMLLASWALFNAGRTWLLNQSLHNMFFMIMCAMVVLRSQTEIDLNGEFGPTLIMLMVAAMRREAPQERQRQQLERLSRRNGGIATPDPNHAPQGAGA